MFNYWGGGEHWQPERVLVVFFQCENDPLGILHSDFCFLRTQEQVSKLIINSL